MRSWAPAPHGALPSELGAGRTCPPPQEGSCSEGLGSKGQKPRCGCAGQAVGREPGATHAWDSALQQGPSPGDSPCCNQGLGWWPGAPSGCSWRWPLSHRASAAHPALPSPLGTQRWGGSGAGRCGGDISEQRAGQRSAALPRQPSCPPLGQGLEGTPAHPPTAPTKALREQKPSLARDSLGLKKGAPGLPWWHSG